MHSVNDLNLSLLAEAQAIVTNARGPRPEARPIPNFGYSAPRDRAAYDARRSRIVAAMESQADARAWDREVAAVFRELKDGSALAPVVVVEQTGQRLRVAA